MKIPTPNKKVKAPTVDALIASAVGRAASFEEVIPTSQENISPSGAAFKIDMLLPVGAETGDGRKFAANALSARELPLPLLWQFKTDSGHNQSVIVGRIDSLEINSAGITNVRGVFDTNPYAREAERLILNGFLKGVSADLDKFSAVEDSPAESELAQGTKGPRKIENKGLTIDKARLMGATVVALPAFQEAVIEIDNQKVFTDPLMEGEYYDGVLEEYSMESLVASAAPIAPPREWFQHMKVSEPTPLTIDDDGRVYGYLALWSSNHIGYQHAQKPPRSATNYKYFRTGVVRTADGTDVTVGNLTLVGGHAPIQASAKDAVKHYDDTNSAVIDVVAGEDQFGIWLAGSLRPGVSPEQVRSVRASALSGDWRPVNGRLELVAACFVNVPGFMTTRTMVASGGQVTALVAAGAQELWEMKNSTNSELRSDIDELRQALFSIQSEESVRKANEVFAPMLTEREELNAKAERALSVMSEESNLREAARLSELAEDIQRRFYA